MLGGFIFAAVLELNHGVASERHQVGEQEAISGFDFIFVVLRLLHVARADGMSGEGQRHVESAPIIAAAAPFFRSGALSLRRLAVVEEKARITFQRAEIGAIGKDPRRSDKIARPIAAAFGLARVEQDEILAGSGLENRGRSRENIRPAFAGRERVQSERTIAYRNWMRRRRR